MLTVPRSYRTLQPKEEMLLTLMLAVRIACASGKLSVNDVFVSTPVRGDLSINPEIEVGRELWFEECSKIHMIAYYFVSTSHY